MNKKKTLLTICLLTLLMNLSVAQDDKSGLSISLKSGVTFANMYGPDVENETFLNGNNPETFYANYPASSEFKNDFNVGLSLDYRFGKYVSLGLGASYIPKGARINVSKHWNNELQTYEDVNGEIKWNQNFWTIELPITIYLPVKQNDFYIQAGIFGGFLINSEEKGDIKLSGQEYEYINNRSTRTNEKEPGFFLGCGYSHSSQSINGKLFIELSWTRSVISSGGDEMIPDPQYYYNQTIGINIGYRYYFSFSKK